MEPNSEPVIEPTASAYSPLFELRAWRLELDRLALKFTENAEAIERIGQARREVDAWIEARTRQGGRR